MFDRRLSFVAAIALLITVSITTQIHARETAVQQWKGAAAKLQVNTTFPTGEYAAPKVQIQNFTPDFRFDPRDLKNSQMMFTASFMPVELPGNRAIDDDIRAAAFATFTSTSMRQLRGDNDFEALGKLAMNGREIQILFPFTVTAGTSAATPRLVFTSTFNAPVGTLAPQLGLQQLPLVMHVEAVPFP